MAVRDGQPYLEKKSARIARAGIQMYTADEIAARGLIPAVKKAVYTEYRPAEVVLRNLDKFNMVPFVNDHTPVDITAKNWKDYTVGAIGSSAGVEVVDDEIFITNDVVFYDEKAYDDYKAGKIELSAGYDAKSVPVKNPEAVGYDFILVDIPAVNHVALCDCARAGHNARILDSLNIDQLIGGSSTMGKKSSPFAFLAGFGKAKDSALVLSKEVFDSLSKFGKLDEEGKKKEILGVMAHVSSLGDSDEKEYLVAAISDSFTNVDAVLADKENAGKIIDGLYAKCKDADEKAAKAVVDTILGTSTDDEAAKAAKDKADKEAAEKAAKEKAEKEGKGGEAKDTAKLVEETIAKSLAGVADSVAKSIKDELPALVDKTVKEALGLKDGGAGSSTKDSHTDDSAEHELDPSFLVRGVFGTH